MRCNFFHYVVISYLMNVEPVEDVDGPEMLSDVVLPELPHPLLQRGRVDQLLEVGVVEALLGAERDLTLDFLKKKKIMLQMYVKCIFFLLACLGVVDISL